jgi:antitoxin CcdA
MTRHVALHYDANAPKKAKNLYLNESLLALAKDFNINVSRACEHGLQMQITKVLSERWLEENRAAIESSNEYVERQGLPLAKFRQF